MFHPYVIDCLTKPIILIEQMKPIPDSIQQFYIEENEIMMQSADWISFNIAYRKLQKSLSGLIPFDPKFNSINWVLDVSQLLCEIAFSYCWMRSYVRDYKIKINPGERPSHGDFKVSYFADNCTVRIASCREKLALMIWAYYCPFSPEKKDEIYSFTEILKRLKNPHKYCLKITNQQKFTEQLQKLENNVFNKLLNWRHLKIHRFEPNIQIYGIESFHDWGYMLPIIEKSEIESFDKNLEKMYPKDPDLREAVKQNCYIDGVLYDRIKMQNHLINYDEMDTSIKECLILLLRSSAGCIKVLSTRSPLRKHG